MEMHQRLVDNDEELVRSRKAKQRKKKAWPRSRFLRRILQRTPRSVELNDQKTVNISTDSTSPHTDESFASSFPVRFNESNASLPSKQIYYIPKFTDPVAAFSSDDVESFFAQLDVKDDNAKVYLAPEGTEVVLYREDEENKIKGHQNDSNVSEDIFTALHAQPWDGVATDARPVNEIFLPNQETGVVNESAETAFSNSFDHLNLREEIFASLVADPEKSLSNVPLTKQQKLKKDGSFQPRSSLQGAPTSITSVRTTSTSKQSTAMLKRKSAFTGEDLLTQEAEVFSEFLEENSPTVPPSPISAASLSKELAQSRLISALNAVDVSDDDDSLGPGAFHLDKYYSTVAAARSAASEAAASLPAYSQQSNSSVESDVFSKVSSTGDVTSRLSYDTGDVTTSYAPSVQTGRRMDNEDLCMGFFFPADPIEDDLSLQSYDISELSQFQQSETEEAFVKFQRMAQKSTSDFFGLLK